MYSIWIYTIYKVMLMYSICKREGERGIWKRERVRERERVGQSVGE
jgi:hypothetical protein